MTSRTDTVGGLPDFVEEATNALYVFPGHLDTGLPPSHNLGVAARAFNVQSDHRGVRVEIDRRFVRHHLAQSKNALQRNPCRWISGSAHLDGSLGAVRL